MAAVTTRVSMQCPLLKLCKKIINYHTNVNTNTFYEDFFKVANPSIHRFISDIIMSIEKHTNTHKNMQAYE